MTASFTPDPTWKDNAAGATPILAANLNNIEGGITSAVNAVNKSLIVGSQTNPALDNTLIGSGGLPNPAATTLTGLTVSTASPNPTKYFLGALAGFLNVSGTVASSVGTPGGGSTQVYGVNVTGPAGVKMPQALNGFEGIGSAVGTSNVTEIIGIEGTTFVSETTHADMLISVLASQPFSNGGTPTVDNAYSLFAQEPTIGTNRFAISATGRTALIKGTASNALEIRANATLIQWASDGSKFTGYASDGASGRIILDPTDGATQRVTVNTQGSGYAFISLNFGTPKFEVAFDGSIFGAGGLGVNGKSPAAQAAAITSPASDTSGTKAAIDAIRAALTNVGITA